MNKVDLMKELIDRYEQLHNMEGCKAAKEVVELYIKKLEMKLKELL